MSRSDDLLQRIARVAQARDLSFVELVELAELDPGTAFRGATLRGSMRDQDLRGFDFTDAEFLQCDLSGADLWWTEGITPEMLDGAITDAATRRPRSLFWSYNKPPEWADRWGIDRYGPWVSIAVAGDDGTKVEQRLRWCPPGHFLMGSPPEESGRYHNEGPQHEVTLSAIPSFFLL